MVTINSTGAVVEAGAVTATSTANNQYLGSSFEILKFLATMAVLAAGMWVLNRIFNFVPKFGGQ